VKTFSLLFLAQLLCCGSVFSQNPRWKIIDEKPIPAHADLDVRWEASMNNVPPTVKTYRLLPERFSGDVISNVVGMCSLSEKDKKQQGANAIVFQSSTGARKLFVSLASGAIHYEIPEPQYGPNKLAEGVPEMNQLPKLATNFLRQIGIPISDVTGYFGTDTFNFSEPLTMYYVGDTTITNIGFRSVKFRRSVDGIPVVGGDGGGFDVGEHGNIIKIDIVWHNLEPGESYPTVPQGTIMGFLRQGKAFQGLLPMSIGEIDWKTVKSITVKKALPCYFSGNSNRLIPFLVLFTTVDDGHESLDVQIECPVIDEAKL
jgi:hypothetical protein